MTRQQTTDSAERAAMRRYRTQRALAALVADAARRDAAGTRLELALRMAGTV